MITLEDIGLEKHSDNPLYQKFISALDDFLEDQTMSDSVTYVFLKGSFAKGNLTEHSDIDCIIVDSNITKSIYINESVNEVVLDYEIVSEKILRDQIENGRENRWRMSAQSFVNAILIYGDSSLDYLITLAKEVNSSPIPTIAMEDLITRKTFYMHQIQETDTMLQKGHEINFHLRVAQLVQDTMFNWFYLNNELAVGWKHHQQTIRDQTLLKLIEQVLTSTTNELRYSKLYELLQYSINLINVKINKIETTS